MGLSQIHILVVDDEEDIRELIRDQFENFGFCVDTASGGDEAWELFQKHTYQVVITDVRMPKGTGPELLKKIKSKNVHTPKVFFISGHYDLALEEIYHLGADGLFPKPFSATVLRESIKKATMPLSQKWAQKKVHSPERSYQLEINDSQTNIVLGRGGFFIQVEDRDLPNVEEEVEFELDLQEFLGVVKGDGRVIWTRGKDSATETLQTGFGLEILWLDKSCLERFKSYVETHSILFYIPKG